MITFRRVKFKSVVLKDYDPRLIRFDIHEMFWCKHYQQYTCMAQCISRYHHREEYMFGSCHKCSIRKATFRAYRVPRIIVRKPRESSDVDD